MTEPVLPILPGLGWSVMRSPRFAVRKQTAISGRQLRIIDQPYPIYTWTLTYDFLRDSNDVRQSGGIGVGLDELRTLMGFWEARQGSLGSFLFDDPTDNAVTGGVVGIGDGTTTQFQLVRRLGTFGAYYPVYAPNIVTAIYDNGPSAPGSSGTLTTEEGATLLDERTGEPLGFGVERVSIPSEPAILTSEGGAVLTDERTGAPLGSGGWSVDPLTGLVVFGAPPVSGHTITADFTYYWRCHFTDDSADFENFMFQLWTLKQIKFESVLL